MRQNWIWYGSAWETRHFFFAFIYNHNYTSIFTNLWSVQYKLVSLSFGGGAEVGGITSVVWLGQAVGSELVHGAELGNPFLRKFLAPKLINHPGTHTTSQIIDSKNTGSVYVLEKGVGWEWLSEAYRFTYLLSIKSMHKRYQNQIFF